MTVTGPRRTGIANLPLHGGKAPKWLFDRMVRLGREITLAIRLEYGPEEILRRLSEPHWFQALGCVLGFDWHSSGVTTTVCGALKEAVRGIEPETGLYVCGGKGATSRKTPEELTGWGETLGFDSSKLVYSSKMSAKVDSAAVQDGYQLYQHNFFFTPGGPWTVVQQGMNETNHYARRYHWLSESFTDFVNEPHAAVASEAVATTLNLVAAESLPCRELSKRIAIEQLPEKTLAELKKLPTLTLPRRHQLLVEDLHPDSIAKILLSTYERQPQNFEQLLGLSGVGAKTLRALSLIAEIIHGVPPSYRDPARYSFAHGGKDGIPYPVNRPIYDKSIELLATAVRQSKLQRTEREDIFRRLDRFRC